MEDHVACLHVPHAHLRALVARDNLTGVRAGVRGQGLGLRVRVKGEVRVRVGGRGCLVEVDIVQRGAERLNVPPLDLALGHLEHRPRP